MNRRSSQIEFFSSSSSCFLLSKTVSCGSSVLPECLFFGVSDCAGGLEVGNSGAVGVATVADSSSLVFGELVGTVSLVTLAGQSFVISSVTSADMEPWLVLDKSGCTVDIAIWVLSPCSPWRESVLDPGPSFVAFLYVQQGLFDSPSSCVIFV